MHSERRVPTLHNTNPLVRQEEPWARGWLVWTTPLVSLNNWTFIHSVHIASMLSCGPT